MNLRGLPLRSGAVVALGLYYFTVIALTVDQSGLAEQKFHKPICGTCDSDTFKVNEFCSTTHSTPAMGLWRLHGYVLFLLAMGVAETPELNHQEGCTYFWPYSISLNLFVCL